MPQASIKQLLLSGIVPLVLFTYIEEHYGVQAGLVAAMVYGAIEVAYEKLRYRKVEKLTYFGNGLILFFGVISLVTQDGIWFKLQPAILEFTMGIGLLVAFLFNRNFLFHMMKQQLGRSASPGLPPEVEQWTRFLLLRLSIFLFCHAGIATYAAFEWSTRAWMLLKGVGFTLTMVIYLLAEALLFRKKMTKNRRGTEIK